MFSVTTSFITSVVTVSIALCPSSVSILSAGLAFCLLFVNNANRQLKREAFSHYFSLLFF